MISMVTGAIFTVILFHKTLSVECFVTRQNAPRLLFSFTDRNLISILPSIPSALFAEQSGKNKRRRKRKQGTKAPADSTFIDDAMEKIEERVDFDAMKVSEDDVNESRKEVKKEIENSATSSEKKFVFNRDEAIALGITDADEDEEIIPEFAPASQTPSASLPKLQQLQEKPGGGAIDLPDIKDAVKRKKSAKDPKVEEEEEDAVQEKISRKDIKSVVKLLEVEPQADSDLSFFQEEEYGTVSILLGEGTKPFLGIPSGPLQVGHFIGAIVIFLMAFIEYPGFPLTNLPTPLRDAFQGGLGAIYAINTVLAILSTLKAEERDQPKLLWAIKTFTVGGLAYDQLTQLPTAEQLKEAKSKKGKRAWKKSKK